MKNQFLLVIIISLLLVQFGYSAAVAQTEVSCPNGTSQTNQWYWDGQKCESCSNNCACDASSSCVRCLSTSYVKIQNGTNYLCVECPGRLEYLSSDSKGNYGSNYKLYLKDYWDDSEYSELFTDSSFQLVQKCYNQASYLKVTPTILEDARMGLQAVTCVNSVTLSSGEKIKSYSTSPLGSICWFLKGCSVYYTKNTTRVNGQGLIGACDQCYTGYYLESDFTCASCIANCAECDGANTCTTCESGYWLADPTDVNMTYVNQTNKDLAKNLTEKYKTCIQCSDVNGECYLNTEKGTLNHSHTCIQNSTYYYNEATGKCAPCTIGCSCAYSASQSSYQQCLNDTTLTHYQCFTGYIENKQLKICQACPNNCTKCSSTSSCDSGYCQNGFRRDRTGSCVACTIGARCKTSDAYAEIPTQCFTDATDSSLYQFGSESSTTPSYMKYNSASPYTNDRYLINSKCIKNKNLCKKMADDSGNCASCYTDSGYFLNPSLVCEFINTISQCTSRSSTNSLCLSCSSSNDITTYGTVVKNYYLSSDKKSCIQCQIGCLTCTTATACETDSCQKGYYYNQTICYQCAIENCQNCDDSVSKGEQTCTTCFPYYRLWQNTQEQDGVYYCEKCETYCQACQNKRKYCTQCDDGYYIQNGACVPRKENCIQMTQKNDVWGCLICAYGYRIVDGKCMPCFSPAQGLVHCPYSKKASNYFYTNINVDKNDAETYN